MWINRQLLTAPLLFGLSGWAAHAQPFAGQWYTGSLIVGNCLRVAADATQAEDAGTTCGGGAIPPSSITLSNGHIIVGNASNVGTDVALSGDATILNTGAITVTKSGGVAFGTAAFVNTGTSGGTVPLLNAANTFSALQTINLNAASAPSAIAGTGLQLVGTDATVGRAEIDTFGAIGAFSIRRADGTGASPTALASNDQIGAFNFHGYYVTGGPGYSGVQASVQGFAAEAWTSTAQGTKLALATTPTGSTTLTTGMALGPDQGLTLTPAANATGLTLTSGGNTGSNAASAFSLTHTLSTLGSPDVVKWAITDTARGASTKLFNIYAGASGTTSVFSVDRLGSLTTTGGITLSTGSAVSGGNFVSSNGHGLVLRGGSGSSIQDDGTNNGIQMTNNAANAPPSAGLQWYTNASITSPAVATLHLGAADAASAVAQTLGVQGVVAGTSNVAGALWSFQDSIGTGSATSGGYAFNVHPAGGSGTAQNAASKALGIDGTGAITMPSLAASSSAQTGTLCWTTGTGNVTVDTTTTCLLSSRAFKHDIAPLSNALSEVMALRPVHFRYNDALAAGGGEQVGLIAEDVAAIDPRLAGYWPDGSPKAVRYQNAVALLVAAMQEQQQQIEDLQRRAR